MPAMSGIPKEKGKGRSPKGTVSRPKGVARISDIAGVMELFYRQAAEKSANPEARMTFLLMAEEEQKQIETLGPMHGAGSEEGRTIGRMISSFERSERALLKKVNTSTDEIGALRIAMEMEKENIRFYANLLCKIEDPLRKAMVQRLLKEEQERYAINENTVQFLTGSDCWSLWGEQGCTDGGTPWA